MPEFSALGWAGIVLVIVGLLIVLLKAFVGRPAILESDNPIVIVIKWLIGVIEKGMKDANYLGWALMAFGAILLIADVYLAGQAPTPEPEPSPAVSPSPTGT